MDATEFRWSPKNNVVILADGFHPVGFARFETELEDGLIARPWSFKRKLVVFFDEGAVGYG